jgi:hypothetical protein
MSQKNEFEQYGRVRCGEVFCPGVRIHCNGEVFTVQQIYEDNKALKKELTDLKSELILLKKLVDEIYFAPGNPGFITAHLSFEELKNK